LTDEVEPFRYAGGAALYGSIGRIGHSNVSDCSYRITKCCLGARVQSRAHNSCGHVPGCNQGDALSCQPTRLRPLLTPCFGCSAGLRRRASMPDDGNDPSVGADGFHPSDTPMVRSITQRPPNRSGGGQLFFAYFSVCPRVRSVHATFRPTVAPPPAGPARISTTCAGRRAPLNMGRPAASSSDDWLYRLTTPIEVPGAHPRCRSGVRGSLMKNNQP
jgi:hypothetical protein